MTKLVISVPEISCEHCKNAIEGALRPLAGVDSAQVDIPARQVAVAYAPPADLVAITAAIEDAGYDVGRVDEVGAS